MNTNREGRLQATALVTGAGTGIGRALSFALANLGINVLGVGRREHLLQETRDAFPDLIHILVADLATEEGRRAVIAAEAAKNGFGLVVHNAATLQPVAPLLEIDHQAWIEHMAINVHAPLFLTQLVVPHMVRGGRILNISSGAAHNAYRGWGAYCTSKAALHMIYQVLKEELADRELMIGSARPGVVDTPMQAEVRTASPEIFPDLQRFLDLKDDGNLQTPAHVAKFLTWLLLDVDDEKFTHKEWDVRDAAHHEYWDRH
ncbi:SDR family NAD(P)-dependent oxidoreductase [Acanthopleuribacter pedis]|uniref:SDR family NAD(P)-dependent oxidoreductase n=1 Tax=Acanthopleuribacter pedis TaxID=442870 RepID=A0A8J7QM00_9BACT|nr:SDR family NAD(P)-dependent oxidoreductase [Acanthopleuribacter pedis]MBO1320798.1 SDR family NAD(P)-dependent oxidoreductase [Acanthopleuribacter pedis]